MLTVVLAPVDRSRSAGSTEMSRPLRIASSKWAEGSAPMAPSCSGPPPSPSPSWSEMGSLFFQASPVHWPSSLPDSSVSGTWVRKEDVFSCLTTGLGLNMAGSGPCSAPIGDPPRSGLGVDAVLRRGRGGSWRISLPPGRPWSLRAGGPLPSGHSGEEAGCFSLIRVSQASATIF